MENEEILFKLIDKVDNESYKLFSEIVDLKVGSLYKVENISSRLEKLTYIYEDLCNAYEYFENKEESNAYDATRRFQLKRILACITTVYAFLANPLLGIGSFVLLNTKASNDYIKELEDFDDAYFKFDEDQMGKIGITLENSIRILNGKIKKMKEKNNIMGGTRLFDYIVLVNANNLIKKYIQGKITKEIIHGQSEIIKYTIKDILNSELKVSINNLDELLEYVKKDYNSKQQFENEYNKTKKLLS